MGTNYYWYPKGRKPCPTCGITPEPLHIGKSSAGWCFQLRIHRHLGIESLEDWIATIADGGEILDEYGKTVEPLRLIQNIAFRSGASVSMPQSVAWYAANSANPGPRGLARAGDAVAGKGTWDLHENDFS